MKKTFTLEELIKNKGCYTEEQITEFYSDYNRDVTIVDVLENKNIEMHHKQWFLYTACELTINPKIKLAGILGKAVFPIFNKKHPEDDRVAKCWQAIEDFDIKAITKELLLEKRDELDNIYNSYDTVGTAAYYAVKSAYYTATAIYYDIFNDDFGSFWADIATGGAVSAAIESKDPVYSQLLNKLMIDFVNSPTLTN